MLQVGKTGIEEEKKILSCIPYVCPALASNYLSI
jgi:hypothetical protein